MKKIAMTLAALMALTGTGQAADLILDTPDVEYDGAFEDWSGFYAGVVGGYGYTNSTSTNANTGTTGTVPLGGALVGIAVGGNHQIDNVVLGAEAEIMWSGLHGSSVCDVGTNCTGSILWLGSVRGRAGVAVDSWLLYGTLGVAAGGFSAIATPAVFPATGTFNGPGFGWTAGAGVEVAVAENVSVKGEYSYYSLGVQAPVGTIGSVSPYNLNANIHTAKVGVNFSF